MRIPPRRNTVPAVLVVFLLSILVSAYAVGGQQTLRPLLLPGEKAPGFSLKDVDGNTIAFRPGRGKPALVVFWSVFCPICREAMPDIERFAARYGKAVRVVAVNLDGKRFTNAVRSWLKENHPRFPVVLDEIRDDFFIASDPYGVEKTPTVILIDGSGSTRFTWAAEGVRKFGKDAEALVAGLRKAEAPGQ